MSQLLVLFFVIRVTLVKFFLRPVSLSQSKCYDNMRDNNFSIYLYLSMNYNYSISAILNSICCQNKTIIPMCTYIIYVILERRVGQFSCQFYFLYRQVQWMFIPPLFLNLNTYTSILLYFYYLLRQGRLLALSR